MPDVDFQLEDSQGENTQQTLNATWVLKVPDTLSPESLVQDMGNNTINAIQEPGSEEKEHPSIQPVQDSAENISTVEQE